MHPRLSRQKTQEYVWGLFNDELTPQNLQFEYVSDGHPDLTHQIEDAIDAVLEAWRDMKVKSVNDEVEGILSLVLFREFSSFPARVLTDPDFWRYCSLKMESFIWARHPKKAPKEDDELINDPPFRYFGAISNSHHRDCVPLRMFNRARLSELAAATGEGVDGAELAKVKAGDVWKSHILRVMNGNSPTIVREILMDTRDIPKFTSDKKDGIRPLAKELRRVRSNVLFELLEQPQARNLIETEKRRLRSVSSEN